MVHKSNNMEENWQQLINNEKYTCIAHTNDGKRCSKKAKFQHTNNNELMVCYQHTKPKKQKNTMLDREGSWKYAICMSLQVANTPFSIEKYDDTMDANVCFYCKKDFKESKLTKTFDHIYNLIDKGGKPTNKMIADANNKILCCSLCNSSKGNKDVVTWALSKDLSHDTIKKIEERKQCVPNFPQDVYAENILKPFDIACALTKEVSLWVAGGDYSNRSKAELFCKISCILF